MNLSKLKMFAAFAAAALSFIAQAQQKTADSFVFPVGTSTYAPTEANVAGEYHISQHFDTSAIYGNGGANGAWCADSSFTPQTAYTTISACQSAGYKWIFGHTGNDLSNGNPNGIVRAISNGVVEKMQFLSGGYGNVVVLKHVLPGGAIIHSGYFHLNDFATGLAAGQEVLRGATIGHVGNTGLGVSGPPHSHFTLYSDVLPPPPAPGLPGYVYYDGGSDVPNGWLNQIGSLQFMYDGLLFVDERLTPWQTGATFACCNVRTQFVVPVSMTGKTMYIENTVTGVITSLPDAVSRGWITSQLSYLASGTWYFFTDNPIDNRVFEPGTNYGITALVTGLRLHGFYAGNHYLEERARQDMRQWVNQQYGQYNVAIRDTLVTYADNFDPNSYIRQMQFWHLNGSAWEIVYVSHGRDKVNPMHRRVQIWINGGWTSWVPVSPWF